MLAVSLVLSEWESQFKSPCQLVYLKKLFFFFYPHTLTFRLKRPVYRGFSGEGKCEGKLSPLTLALTPQSVWNPSCPVKVQSRSNENQKINQKEINQKTDPWKDSEKKSVQSVSVFLILSSVAAGSQSARQQIEWRMKKQRSAAEGKANYRI